MLATVETTGPAANSGRQLQPCRVIAVVNPAGGDGTLRSAAARIAGTAIPLAILPLGTRNHFARSRTASSRAGRPRIAGRRRLDPRTHCWRIGPDPARATRARSSRLRLGKTLSLDVTV